MAAGAFVLSGALALALAVASDDNRLELGVLAVISAAVGLAVQALSRPRRDPGDSPDEQRTPAPDGWETADG